MGPFCVTRSNPTHQLTDPTQPNPWVNPIHGQVNSHSSRAALSVPTRLAGDRARSQLDPQPPNPAAAAASRKKQRRAAEPAEITSSRRSGVTRNSGVRGQISKVEPTLPWTLSTLRR